MNRRRSKQPQEIPVIPVDVGGTKYVVSTRGESEWVKNLRADPNVKIGATTTSPGRSPSRTVNRY